MNLALFDFDGTITTGDTFTPFLRFAMVYAYGDSVEDREMLALANRRYYRWKEVTAFERVG